MFKRSFVAVALAAVFLALAPAGAVRANPDQDQEDDRDGQSRHEVGQLNHLPLVLADNRFMRVVQIVVLLRTVQYLSLTAAGVDFNSDDRVGLGGVPVIGGLFEKTYDEDDFTEENRIGSVFRDGDGTMAVVLSSERPLDGVKFVVFNGKGHYEVREGPKLTEVAPTSLAQLGAIPSMEQLLRGQAAKETVQLLAGLLASGTPKTETPLPALGDIPLLQKQFLGTAHEGDDDELVLMIRPSIVMGDES